MMRSSKLGSCGGTAGPLPKEGDMKKAASSLSVTATVLFLATLVGAAGPELAIQSPKPGETIRGGLVVVKFAVKDFKIVDFTKDAAVSETKGHVHIQLDENPYSTIHTASNVFVFAGVKPGKHKIELELVHGDHTPLKTQVEKTVEFTVVEK
jgi:hypothetical protein